jgi:hypothetical protein
MGGSSSSPSRIWSLSTRSARFRSTGRGPISSFSSSASATTSGARASSRVIIVSGRGARSSATRSSPRRSSIASSTVRSRSTLGGESYRLRGKLKAGLLKPKLGPTLPVVGSKLAKWLEPVGGVEHSICRLQIGCSSVELHRHLFRKTSKLVCRRVMLDARA